MSEPRVVRAKVVIVGAPGVGKSSLVRRFVHSIFSEEYHSTLGVKVDRKKLDVYDCEVTMLVWDMHGETEGLDVPDHYLRGASGSLAVFDATRPETAAKAIELQGRVKVQSSGVRQVVIANKADLDPDWAGVQQVVQDLGVSQFVRTSALTGDAVEDAFLELATQIWVKAGGILPE